MKALLKTSALALTLLTSSAAFAKPEKYVIDPTHSFVQFKVSHLGFSWLIGRFNKMEGNLYYDDQNVENSSVKVTVDMTTLDSNHAKRDKHLKSDDYIDAGKYKMASFESRKVEKNGDKLMITGDLTFRKITKPLTIEATLVGAGKSPWGDTRRGYEGIAKFDRTDFGMKGKAGSDKAMVELNLFIEAINK